MIKTDNIIKPIDYDHNSLSKEINSLCKKYTFIKRKSIGKSVLGKDITALYLGSAHNTLIISGFHGNEHITSNILLMWFEGLCKSLKSNTSFCGINMSKALFGRGIIIVPMINPDGCDIAMLGSGACGKREFEIRKETAGHFHLYDKNYNGADIFRNFGKNNNFSNNKLVDKFKPSPTTNDRKYIPEGEPETKALCNLCRSISIRDCYSLMTGGNSIEYSSNGYYPKRSRKIAEILSTSSSYSINSHIKTNELLDFKDWFIKEFDRPAFTLKIGAENNPPIIKSKALFEEIKETLTLSVIL